MERAPLELAALIGDAKCFDGRRRAANLAGAQPQRGREGLQRIVEAHAALVALEFQLPAHGGESRASDRKR